MRILHISDTHGRHRLLRNLPNADVIVHSGDFTMNGSEDEAFDFINWFCDLPHLHKIFIGGNHDDCLYGANVEGLDGNVHYLCHSGIEIDDVQFYGVPLFSEEYGMQAYHYANIPGHVDVLITHEPPYGVLDFSDNIHYGSIDLLIRTSELSPRLHLFGHIHPQRGTIDLNGTIFSNGAIPEDVTQSHYIEFDI